MNLIDWINGITKLNKTTMDQFQNNINEAIEYNSLPIGAGCDYWGTTLPSDNFAWADGSAISREDYPIAFQRLGTSYGVGDGSTTFNLPDKRERVSVMYKSGSTNGTSGATLGTLGAKGGEFKHTQTVAEMAEHNHSNIQVTGLNISINGSGTGGVNIIPDGSASPDSNTVYTSSAGNNQAMNIMQPYIVCNYIIRIK